MATFCGLDDDPDYKVLYDVREGVGYVVLLYRGDDVAKGFSLIDTLGKRSSLMALARRKASEFTSGLIGTVHVGYDPSILSPDVFKGE